MTEHPLVSVILVNYNGLADLRSSLPALLSQSYPRFEVIVVDNDSADGSVEALRKEFPEVAVIEANRNLGFGAGNNLGIRNASGEYVVFTNYDVDFDVNWLSELVRAAETDERVGIVAPKIMMFDQRDLVQTCGLTFQYTGHAFSRGYLKPSTAYADPEVIGCATGCCFLIKRRVLDQVGAFDPDFHAFSSTFFHSSLEDVDLCWRAQLAGYWVLFEPKALMYHKYEQKPLSPLRYYYLECGRYSILTQNYGAKTFIALGPALAFSEWLGWSYVAIKGPKFFAEKMRSYWWLTSNLRSVLRKRSRAQALRCVPDAEILDRFEAETELRHSPLPPVLNRVAAALPNQVFRAYKRVVLKAIRAR